MFQLKSAAHKLIFVKNANHIWNLPLPQEYAVVGCKMISEPPEQNSF